jgi:hypothetical protein
VLDKAYSENLDALTRLHEQHALVYVGPQILAMSKTDWDGALPALYHLRALAIEYKNQLLFGKTNPVDLWLASKTRTLYRRLVFQPGRVVDKNYFNTFTGWACVPRPGDCSLFLAHLREVICGRDEGLFQYVLQWLAHLVQFPGKLIGTALAMGSEPGAGKGSVYYYLREFLGRYAVRLDGSELIQNPFNDFLASRLLVFGDETLWHGDKRTLNRVKGYITEPTLVVNKKHVPVFEIENFARFIFSTNDALSAPLELKDRRYVPLPTLPLHIGDARYWEALYAERQAGGGAALLHHLLHEVRIERNLRTAPETAARAEQRLLNLEPVGEWWREMLMSEAHESRERNSSDRPRVTLRFGDVVRTADLHWLFVEWTQRTRKHAMSIDALGRRLRDYITLTTRESRKGELDPRPGESPRVKVYELPALVDARAQFERAVQCALDWDEGDTEPTL